MVRFCHKPEKPIEILNTSGSDAARREYPYNIPVGYCVDLAKTSYSDALTKNVHLGPYTVGVFRHWYDYLYCVDAHTASWSLSIKYDEVIQLFVACARVIVPVHMLRNADFEEGMAQGAICSRFIERILCRKIVLLGCCRQRVGSGAVEYIKACNKPNFLFHREASD